MRARWQPTYDIQLQPAQNRVELSLAGLVSQETGEDWSDVALTLSTAIPATATQFVNVRPTMFDIPAWSRPFIESFTSEKLPWASTSAKHSFDRFPAPEQYGMLVAEYAAQAG